MLIEFIKEKKLDIPIDIQIDEPKKEKINQPNKIINQPIEINNNEELNQSTNINNKPIKGSIEISNLSTKIRYFIFYKPRGK